MILNLMARQAILEGANKKMSDTFQKETEESKRIPGFM